MKTPLSTLCSMQRNSFVHFHLNRLKNAPPVVQQGNHSLRKRSSCADTKKHLLKYQNPSWLKTITLLNRYRGARSIRGNAPPPRMDGQTLDPETS